jgi:endonuclease/exonuclease/phosphatase family metal-dependent hydrolase
VKTVFLNTWRGACGPELADFVAQEAPSTDIFCFQEASPKTRERLAPILGQFVEFAHAKPAWGGGNFDMATYVARNLNVLRTRVLFEGDGTTGSALVTDIHDGSNAIRVANVHGVAYKADDKGDNLARLRQSKGIIEAVGGVEPVIVGGDFNLDPHAKSVRMFAEAGYHNLIDEYGIETTRNHLAWDRFPDRQLYADYAFVTPSVYVERFEVPRNEVSDHLPMVLEFDLTGAEYSPSTYAQTAGHIALSA